VKVKVIAPFCSKSCGGFKTSDLRDSTERYEVGPALFVNALPNGWSMYLRRKLRRSPSVMGRGVGGEGSVDGAPALDVGSVSAAIAHAAHDQPHIISSPFITLSLRCVCRGSSVDRSPRVWSAPRLGSAKGNWATRCLFVTSEFRFWTLEASDPGGGECLSLVLSPLLTCMLQCEWGQLPTCCSRNYAVTQGACGNTAQMLFRYLTNRFGLWLVSMDT